MNETTLYGGSTANTSSVSLTPMSTRSQTFYNGVLCSCVLFPYAIVRTNQRGLWFHVAVRGSADVSLTDGTTTWTLTPGKVAKCFVTSTGWRVVQYTIGTARSVGNSTRAAVSSESTESAITDCFNGDPCVLAKFEGNEPLDGRDGRDLCIVPMAQDVTRFAKNATREPIRAADIVMPKVLPLTLSLEGFTPDPLHPLASTVLPQSFYDVLLNNGAPHPLDYQGTLNGVTRNWHHARYILPSTWRLGTGSGAFSVRRHYWERIVHYTQNGITYNVTIRVYAEHTLSSDPALSPTGSGPKMDTDNGIWGTLFSVVVFCDQLSPSFADGGSFTPYGWSSGTTFTKADPSVWGKAYGVTIADQSKRGCHPQVVMLGHLVTTFESPMGSDYVPVIDRTVSTLGVNLKNRSYCYEVSNGTPWIVGGCDPAPNGVGVKGNIVFGSSKCAAMTLGGGFPKSELLEMIVWENGTGIGLTYLKPVKSGWDEICGDLDVENGSSGSLKICKNWRAEDGSGWPGYEPTECLGHIDEPFEGVGGGHSCFNNNGGVTNCCISTTFAVSTLTKKCTKSMSYYDEECVLDTDKSVACENAGTFSDSFLLEFEDFDYVMDGDQDTRLISYVTYGIDPSVPIFDLVYSGSGTDWVDHLGSFTYASNISGSGSASGVVKAFCAYEPTAVFRDYTLKATGVRCMTDVHCLGMRSEYISTKFKGYMGVVSYSSGSNGTAKIEYHDGSGSSVALASKNITNFDSNSVEMEFKSWGSDLTFKWKIGSHSQEVIEAQHCLIENGFPALCSESTGTVEFTNVSVEDESYTFSESFATLEKHRVEVYADDKLSSGYGKCDEVYNSGCGTPPNCSCKLTQYTLEGDNSAVWNETGRDINLPDQTCEDNASWSGSSGDNPTMYNGPMPDPCACSGRWCGSTALGCEDCPPPYINVSVSFVSSCGSDLSRMCSGISEWTFVPTVCA